MLTYQGSLPPSQRTVSPLKAKLRRDFHPQIKERMDEHYPDGPDGQSHRKTVDGVEYLYVVDSKLSLGAELDILLLTPSHLNRPGDVDNRVKTLIDGLTCPRPGVESQSGLDEPQWCLLEDDSLVVRYSLDSRPWLGRPRDSKDTLVIVNVNLVTHGRGTLGSLHLTT